MLAEIKIELDDMSLLFLPRFMTLDEYHEFYLEDIEIRLDSEKLFPYTPSLLRYLEYNDKDKD